MLHSASAIAATLPTVVLRRAVASENTHASVVIVDDLHLIRPGNIPKGGATALSARCRDDRASVAGDVNSRPKCPPQRSGNRQPANVAAGWCADAASPAVSVSLLDREGDR